MKDAIKVERLVNGDGTHVYVARVHGGVVIAGEVEDTVRERAARVLVRIGGKVAHGRHGN